MSFKSPVSLKTNEENKTQHRWLNNRSSTVRGNCRSRIEAAIKPLMLFSTTFENSVKMGFVLKIPKIRIEIDYTSRIGFTIRTIKYRCNILNLVSKEKYNPSH